MGELFLLLFFVALAIQFASVNRAVSIVIILGALYLLTRSK